MDWRDPANDPEKLRLIGIENWGEGMPEHLRPGYLWYCLGEILSLSKEEIEAIAAAVGLGNNFGDLELHRSSQIPGAVVLRLRGDQMRVQPALEIRGQRCPLYLIGNAGYPADRWISFIDLVEATA